MDKITKFINRLSKDDRDKLVILMNNVLANKLTDLKVQKLKGFSDLYKVRYRKIRVVFRREANRNVIINIGYRGNVYRDL